MKIESKFLTSDARIVGARVEGRALVVEGMVKDFLPVKVTMDPSDIVAVGRALGKGALAALRAARSQWSGPRPSHPDRR